MVAVGTRWVMNLILGPLKPNYDHIAGNDQLKTKFIQNSGRQAILSQTATDGSEFY